jgi:single-stranded DNA-binding protein
MNTIQTIGKITREPEIDGEITRMELASFDNQDPRPIWFKVSVKGHKKLMASIKKESLVAITGSMKSMHWSNPATKATYRTLILCATSVHLLEDFKDRLSIVHQNEAKPSVGRQIGPIEQYLTSAKRSGGSLA